MSDENPASSNSNEPLDGFPEAQRPEPTNSPTTPTNPASEFQEVKTELTGYERSTLRWTIVIVVVNALTCLFIGLQWYEIRKDSSDTHTLALAAQTQATKMGSMSDAATKIQQAADGMVTQEKRLADDTEKSLNASGAQNRLALANTIEEFRLEHRAWVSLSEIVFVKLNPGEKGAPIQVYEMHARDKIGVNLDYKNTGSTPAFDVKPVARLDSFPTGPPVFKPLPNESTAVGILQPGEGMFDSMEFDNLTQGYVDAFNLGTVRIYGRIDYHDAFHVAHWATFCRWILSGGAQAGCPEQPDKTDTNPN